MKSEMEHDDEYDEYEGCDYLCEIPLVSSFQETSRKFAAACDVDEITLLPELLPRVPASHVHGIDIADGKVDDRVPHRTVPCAFVTDKHTYALRHGAAASSDPTCVGGPTHVFPPSSRTDDEEYDEYDDLCEIPLVSSFQEISLAAASDVDYGARNALDIHTGMLPDLEAVRIPIASKQFHLTRPWLCQTEPQVQSCSRPVTIGGQVVGERGSADLEFTQTTEGSASGVRLLFAPAAGPAPVLDLDTTAGLGLIFKETGSCWRVLEVLERSAATFGGVLRGDVLLQVDDKVVSGKEDIVRCIGPHGSVVHLKFSRPAGDRTVSFWVSLIREIQASKRPSVNYTLVVTRGTTMVKKRSQYLEPDTRPENTSVTSQSQFVQEARSFVKSGGFLGMFMHEVCMKSIGSVGMHEAQWKSVFVNVIPEGACLAIDKKVSYETSRIVFASLLPDAAADLQELQTINLQHRQSFLNWGSGKNQTFNAGSTFQIHVRTFRKCHAYSQRGLFEVDCTRALDFRASNAHEANMWIQGTNSIVSDRKDPAGVRPSQETVLPENAASFYESLSSEERVDR